MRVYPEVSGQVRTVNGTALCV